MRIDERGEQDDPIQWVLLTTESVVAFSDSLSVVESYRARWTIEDWHKVLKTGCRIEERRLETWERMEVLLSVYSVIAWKVLELRELARGDAHCSPDVLLSETERSILETKFPELTDNEAQTYAIGLRRSAATLTEAPIHRPVGRRCGKASRNFRPGRMHTNCAPETYGSETGLQSWGSTLPLCESGPAWSLHCRVCSTDTATSHRAGLRRPRRGGHRSYTTVPRCTRPRRTFEGRTLVQER